MARSFELPRIDAQLVTSVLALAILAVTFHDPTWRLQQDVYRHLLVFDITQSMNVADAGRPGEGRTRLEHAKEMAVGAMTRLPCGSEIGVGLFTGHRTLLLFAPVEVCAHYGDISTTVRAIDWRMAWIARSEIAKGLHSGLGVARALGRGVSVVLLTDGHEAPPLHPEHRPRYRGEPGEIRGALAGIGGLTPAQIPRLDWDGQRRGVWQADEVMQVDSFSLGRQASVSNEGLVGVDATDVDRRIAAGREHLSSLKEQHLRNLAARLQLGYRRIERADDLAALLGDAALAVHREARADIRPMLGALALALVVVGYAARTRTAQARATQTGFPLSSTSGTP